MPYVSKKNGGIFQYSIALLKILANSEHNYFVYCNDPEEELLHLIEQYPNLKLFQCKKKERKHHIFSRKLAASVLDKILRTIKSDYRVKFINTNFHLKELIKKHQIQIIHSPIQENIFINEKIPTISTMHDVQELHFPMFFDSQERLWRAKNFKHTIENSHAVIVSYEHIKKDIHNYFKKPLEDIYVCLIDMESLWFEKYIGTQTINISEHLKIPNEKFIFYPAATWKHKNHIVLFKALQALNKNGHKINLICSGHKTEYFNELSLCIENLNLLDQIFFIGVVSEEIMYSLYMHTQCVVIPTLYEAGSFPLMESMLLSVPVLCSNVTSLPETIDDERFVFDPNNHEEVANKLENILYHDEFRQENILNSKRKKYKLLNKSTLSRINFIYEQVYSKTN